MANYRKVIVYIASSVDGFIAKPDDDLSFLSVVEREGEDYGYAEFLKSVDTIIMGRKTYDWVMTQVPEFPHSNLDTYIITRTPRPEAGKVQFYTSSLEDLIVRLKSQPGKNIFVDGGAQIVNELLQYNLIDEMIISVIPVVLSGGVKLFQEGRPEQHLNLLNSRQFDSGLVQLHYQVARRDGLIG